MPITVLSIFLHICSNEDGRGGLDGGRELAIGTLYWPCMYPCWLARVIQIFACTTYIYLLRASLMLIINTSLRPLCCLSVSRETRMPLQCTSGHRLLCLCSGLSTMTFCKAGL